MKHIRNGEVVGGVVNEASKVTLSGWSVETSINNINEDLDNVKTSLNGLDGLVFKKHVLSPSTPLTINIGVYGVLLIGGMVQGVGARILAISIYNRTQMEVKDIVKGTAFSSDYLSIVNNNGVVTISVASGITTSTYKYIVF